MKRICVIGNFSGRNAGDAAILGGLLEDVSRLYPDAEFDVPTINPGFVARQYAGYRVRPVPMLPWNLSVKILGLPIFRSVLRSDLVLVTDAILFDLHLFNPLFNYLSTMALVLPLARRRGIPVVLYNVSLGPVSTKVGIGCLRRVLDASSKVIVRDTESIEMLKRVGLERADLRIAADCALNTVPSDDARVAQIIRERDLVFDEQGVVTFNVNSYVDVFVRGQKKGIGLDEFVPLMAEAFDRTIESLNIRPLMVVTQPMDFTITNAVMSRMRQREKIRTVANPEYSYRDLTALFAKAEMHIGMRTHSLILATSVGTPVVGIIATPKNRGYMKSIRQDERMVEFKDLTADYLAEMIRKTWANRKAIREELLPIVAEEKRKARESAAELAPFLKGT